MQISQGKHLFLKIFDVTYIFFDFEYHVVWRSCTITVYCIVPVKNFEDTEENTVI